MSTFLEKRQKIILVTGAAGFIGAALVKRLISEGLTVIGIDNLNSYYEKSFKLDRLKKINDFCKNHNFNWKFYEESIEKSNVFKIFESHKPEIVVNLAAQAGVRFSISNPSNYLKSNILGFGNILEACVKNKVNNLIFASSSSVYGGNNSYPYKETNSADHPLSIYAATKKANELMAHSYSHIYNLPVTGLRFFTVYGPWGRPDMAPMIFANNIFNNLPIKVFNNGNMKRDFTYIDDVIEAVYKCCFKPAKVDPEFDSIYPNPSSSFAPFRVFNIGNSSPVNLLDFIDLLEKNLGKKAIKDFQPMQLGDVISTYADTTKLQNWIEYSPQTSIEEGVKEFAKWYLNYFK
tara:strand:+ start:1328 stop:2371 length:1044 start_codon:yes stop_codon:yes gene_type:complete